MSENENENFERVMPGVVLQRRPPFEQAAGYIPPPPGAVTGQYRWLILNDSTVSACLEFINSSALSRLGEYQHANTEIQQFIRNNLARLEGSFYDFCADMLSCVWAGFSVAEVVTEVIDGKIWLHSLPILPCETVTFVLDENTDSTNYGSIREVWQRPYQLAEAHIPAEKCVIMRNHYAGGLSDNPYGVSRLDCVYDSIITKNELVKKWKRTLERYALPLITWKLYDPNILVKDVVTGQDCTAREAAQHQLEQWDDSAKAFVYGQEDDLKLDYPPSGIGDAFRYAINYHERMEMRGLLLPSLLLEPGDAGSFALGEQHMQMFQHGEDSLLINLTECLIEQLVRKLITWNFGIQSDWGAFEIKRTPNELMTWAQVFGNIKNLGVLDTATAEDVNMVRRQFGFNPLSAEVLQKMQQMSEAAAQEGNKPAQEGTGEAQGSAESKATFQRTEGLLGTLETNREGNVPLPPNMKGVKKII